MARITSEIAMRCTLRASKLTLITSDCAPFQNSECSDYATDELLSAPGDWGHCH